MEKRRIPRLSRKPRDWSKIDPESLTAALYHLELTAAGQVEPPSGAQVESGGAGQVEDRSADHLAEEVEPAGQVEAPGQCPEKAS